MKFFKFIVNFFKNNDTYLKQFNEKKCAHYDFCINNEYPAEYNVLVLGNSISYHPESPNIGWVNTLIGGGGGDKNHGMCASSIDNDYVHILASKITKIIKNKKLYFNIQNIADFERNFKTFNYNLIRDELNQKKYNLVIFQLGDNVNNKKHKKIVKYYKKLINIINDKDKKIIKIITVPFFFTKEKEKMTKTVAESTNSIVVDLGAISKLTCSKAYYDNPYQNEGINNHPGDMGMQIIANEIFAKIKDIICVVK